MKLEDEIKQHHFRNETHKLTVNLFYTYGWLMRIHSKHFEKYDITLQQFNILRILRGQYPESVTINLLKERMLDKMSDVSRLVERLRVKNLVERKVSGDDRRCARVVISKKGLKLLEEMDKLDEKVDKTFSELNEEEKKKLNDLLDKLRG